MNSNHYYITLAHYTLSDSHSIWHPPVCCTPSTPSNWRYLANMTNNSLVEETLCQMFCGMHYKVHTYCELVLNYDSFGED